MCVHGFPGSSLHSKEHSAGQSTDSCEMETFGHQQYLQFTFTTPQSALDPHGRLLGSCLRYGFPVLQGGLPVTDQLNLTVSPGSLILFFHPDPRSHCIHSVKLDKPCSSFSCPSVVGFGLPLALTLHLLK